MKISVLLCFITDLNTMHYWIFFCVPRKDVNADSFSHLATTILQEFILKIPALTYWLHGINWLIPRLCGCHIYCWSLSGILVVNTSIHTTWYVPIFSTHQCAHCNFSQVYYSTLFRSKSMQKEDNERVQLMLHAVMRQLLKLKTTFCSGKDLPTMPMMTLQMFVHLTFRSQRSPFKACCQFYNSLSSCVLTWYTIHFFTRLLTFSCYSTWSYLGRSSNWCMSQSNQSLQRNLLWPDSNIMVLSWRSLLYKMGMKYKNIIKSNNPIKASFEYLECKTPNAHQYNDSKNDS